MRPIETQEWLTHSAEATRNVGACLGQCAEAGDFIACCGPLGAGKTTFVQGFAEGLGVGSEAYVRSPTFTLVHEHRGRYPLYHFDFYRLSHFSEAESIGFDDYCEAPGVVLVEWADKFPELLPTRRLDIWLEITALNTRSIRGMSYDPSYSRYFRLSTSGAA